MRYTAIRLIKEEHRSLAAVLRAAEHLVTKAMATGRVPDFRLLHATLYYLHEFAERRHHRNEDEMLFPRIKARTHEADALIDELEEEHRRGEDLLQRLTAALNGWESGASDGRRFVEVLAVFARFYEAHMNKEETRILPAAERALRKEDWRAILAAFEANQDPMLGEDTADEFRHLFSRMARLAPAPAPTGKREG